MYKAKYTNLKLGTSHSDFPRIGLLVLKPGQFQVIQDKLVIPTKVSILPMSTPWTLLPDQDPGGFCMPPGQSILK